MGLRTFFKNIRYLFKYNVKLMNREIVSSRHLIDMTSDKVEHALPPILSYVDRLYKSDNTIYKPKKLGWNETLQELVSTEKSLIRFADYDFIILAGGRNTGHQKANEKMRKRLIEILESDDERIMIGITAAFWYRLRPCRRGWDWEMLEYASARIEAERYLNKEIYYDAEVSQLFGLQAHDHIDDERTAEWYERWRSIWADKEVAVVCGDRVFNKIECNIFDNARSVTYIYTPTKNAFDEYELIYNKVKQLNKKTIVCLIVGSTAKVLAYDLTVKDGFRCLDVGHLAKDYDCWKRQLTREHELVRDYFIPE